MKKYMTLMGGLVLFGIAGWLLTMPMVFVQTAEGFLAVQKVRAGTPITLQYRHSVQKTPVWEYLEVNEEENGFVLRRTKYQSFGVGLPFQAWEGTFRQEGEYFLIEGIDHPFPTLSIRNGVGNHEVLTVGDRDFSLAELLPLGSEVYLYVCPLYKGLWLKKEIRR